MIVVGLWACCTLTKMRSLHKYMSDCVNTIIPFRRVNLACFPCTNKFNIFHSMYVHSFSARMRRSWLYLSSNDNGRAEATRTSETWRYVKRSKIARFLKVVESFPSFWEGVEFFHFSKEVSWFFELPEICNALREKVVTGSLLFVLVIYKGSVARSALQ